MVGIVEFLNARLDEDERLAKAAAPGIWQADIEETADDQEYVVLAWAKVSVSHGDLYGHANAQHIARHDRERVLREVTAKRDLVAQIVKLDSWTDDYGFHREYRKALIALATVYADHPDYRTDW